MSRITQLGNTLSLEDLPVESKSIGKVPYFLDLLVVIANTCLNEWMREECINNWVNELSSLLL